LACCDARPSRIKLKSLKIEYKLPWGQKRIRKPTNLKRHDADVGVDLGAVREIPEGNLNNTAHLLSSSSEKGSVVV